MPPKAKKDFPANDGMDEHTSPLAESFIGYSIKRAYLLFHADFKAALGKDGITPRTFTALNFVVDHPNISQSDLARRLGVERSGLVAIVDEMERRGFVLRTAMPGDRRIQALVPTQAGREEAHRIAQVVKAREAEMMACLTADEVETLREILLKLRTQAN